MHVRALYTSVPSFWIRHFFSMLDIFLFLHEKKICSGCALETFLCDASRKHRLWEYIRSISVSTHNICFVEKSGNKDNLLYIDTRYNDKIR